MRPPSPLAPNTRSALQRLGRLLALAAAGVTGQASAWVYPEHRDIAVLAVEKLDPERRAVFDDLWRSARATQEARLCELGADPAQGVAPSCIDWAALSAVAGDHSCSAEEMTSTVLESHWILSVADVAARLKVDLAHIAVRPSPEQLPGAPETVSDLRRLVESVTTRAARRNAVRTADNRIQRADSKYATRAYSSNAHFLLARPHTGMTAEEYGLMTLRIGSRINALGVYGWYHLDALQQAARLARQSPSADERQALVRAMLFDEAFALHFLEDAFAAGHVAGTWGNASQRQGTHDYYNEAGLEVFLWRGGSQSVVLMGDANMRPEDAERAAAAVRASLEQLLDTASGRRPATEPPSMPAAAPSRPDAFNVCQNQVLIDRPDITAAPDTYKHAVVADLAAVLVQTPIPGLGTGLGALPRFRSEIGPFVGLAGSIDGRWIDGGFTPSSGNGFVAGVDLAARVGLGLDGVMRDSGDGLAFISVGLRGDTPSTNSVSVASSQAGGNVTSAIPARTAVSTRLRMPFYLIPGDLLLLAPLYFIAPERYEAIAVTAANGGLIPWQSGFATGVGRFQFVLGRELGVTFYGIAGDDRVLAPGAAGGAARVVEYRSTALDLPILEYRAYRSFSSNQSSAVLFQLFTSLDVPHSASVVAPPGGPPVDLRDVWSVGIRLVFDWRYYP